MGNDGGTVATQRKYSRWATKKEEAHVDTEEVIQAKWSTCALSGEPLQEPICSCELGYLFNRIALIQALLDKSLPPMFSYIRKMKDVVDLHFTANPDYKSKYVGDSGDYWQQDILGGKYICPITKEAIGGKTKFCYLRTCGCVQALSVLKEIPSDKCLVCDKPFSEDDVIVINGDEKEREELRRRMELRRAKEKKTKKHHHATEKKEKLEKKNP